MTVLEVPSRTPPAFLTRERSQLMVGVLLSVLLAALDSTIVASAGPRIQRDLAFSPSLYTWLTIAYLVTSTVTLPIAGKLGDSLGRRPLLLFGLSVFVLASLACGLAWNAGALIAFRAVQGLGAGALLAGTSALIADLYPPLERAKMQGMLGAVFGVSSIVGPLLGGFLTDTLSWHWVFFVNVPLGLGALFVIARRLPKRNRPSARSSIDVVGAALLTVATLALLLGVSLGSPDPQPGQLAFAWGSWPIVALVVTFVVSLVAFLLVESRAPDPIVDLRLFKNRTFSFSVAAVFVLGASLLATGVFLPLFLINVVGVSATAAGLSTTPLMFALIGSSILSGQLVARFGRLKPVLLAGLVILIVGFSLLGFTLSTQSTALEVALRMIVVGIGFGPVVSLYTLAVQTALPPARVGVATAGVTFFQQLGGTVGLAVLGAIFAVNLGASSSPDAYAGAISSLFRVGILIVALGLLVTAFLPERSLRAPIPPEDV